MTSLRDQGADPRVEVSGAIAAEERERVRRCAVEAARALGIEYLRVDVLDPRGVSKRLEAAAEADRIWFRPRFLDGGPLLVESVVYEEAAHYKLFQMGVSDEPTFVGVLIHELFAAWFEARQIGLEPNYDREGVLTRPLPPVRYAPEFAYQLGTMLGAAAAGNAEAVGNTRRWFADPAVDPAIKKIARRFEQILEPGGTPHEVAERLASAYRSFGFGPSTPAQRPTPDRA